MLLELGNPGKPRHIDTEELIPARDHQTKPDRAGSLTADVALIAAAINAYLVVLTLCVLWHFRKESKEAKVRLVRVARSMAK
jgi:hypothetical protein